MSAILGPFNGMVFEDGLSFSPLPAWEFPEPTFTPQPARPRCCRWAAAVATGATHREDVPEPARPRCCRWADAVCQVIVRCRSRRRYTAETKTT